MRGDDEINGDFGDDIIFGDNSTGESSADGNDVLRGGYGEDEIYGRGGNDILIGQSGKDTLYGGAGEDIFVIYSVDFNAEDGDTIKDFVDGEDKIGLVGISFDELIILSEGQNTIIQNQSGETVLTLEGVSSTLITTDDFISLNYDLSSNESQVTSSSLYQLSYSYEILDVGPEALGIDNGAGPLSEEFNIFESNHNKTSDFIDIQSHEFSEIDFSNSSIHYETI